MASNSAWIRDRGYRDPWPRLTDEMWLLGYLSSFAFTSDKDFLRDTDNASISLWADNYCKANPLNDLHDAGLALALELMKRKGL
jgi:hypothetical protein